MRNSRALQLRRRRARRARHGDGHARRHEPPRSGRRRLVGIGRRPGGARAPAPVDRRPVGRGTPADVERGRLGVDHVQRRDLQPRRSAPRAGKQGAQVPLAHRHRSDRAPIRGDGRGLPLVARRHVRARHLGCSPRPTGARARSPGQEAALLHGHRRPAAVRVRDQGAAGASRGAARHRSRGAQPLSDVRQRPGAVHAVSRHQEAARRAPAVL